jgi:hypothetical protein
MAERPQDWQENRVPLGFFSKSGSDPEMHPCLRHCDCMDLDLINLTFSLDEIDLGVVQPRICGPTVTTNCRAATLTPPNFGPP